MSKKSFWTVLILCAALLSQTADRCFADVGEQFQQAWDLYASKNYDQAQTTYQQLAQSYPESDLGLTAQKYLVIVHIKAGRLTEAQAAYDALNTGYSGNAKLPAALFLIANIYETSKEHDKAIVVCQDIIQNYPSSPSATDAGFYVARINARFVIQSGDNGSADAVVNGLLADFSSHPDMAKELFKLARNYMYSSRYGKVKGLYQEIIQRYPASPYAIKAQLGVGAMDVMSSIKAKDYSSAQAAVSSLVTSFSGNPGLAAALYEIAIKYEQSEQYASAKAVYQQIVQQTSTGLSVINAQLDIPKTDILSLILAENYTAATSATDSLITDFASHLKLARALYSIAQRYEDSGQYLKAKAEYERVTQQYSASDQAGRSQLDVRKCQVLKLFESGNDSGAFAGIDSLITDFAGSSYLAYAVSRKVAEKYYINAFRLGSQGSTSQAASMFQRALIVWLKVVNQVPASDETPYALSWAADCFQRTGDFTNSIAFYKRVANEYPTHKLAGRSLFSAGGNYADMKALGLLSNSEADAGTKTAYQRLVDTYPDYKGAKHARSWLARHNSN